jgi:hypothetical protein
MALNKNDLITLAKTVANANPSSQVAYSFGEEKFSYSDLNETLRSELKELAGTYQLYRENKNVVFSLIEETINDILPVRVLEQYGQFAEIKTFAQGDKPVFKQKITEASRRRAKQFITKVGLAGVYEVFKLDGREYEIQTTAFGGAAQVSIEEFLDGRVDFADLIEIVMEGLDEAIYLEIEKALIGSVENLAAANKYAGAGFNETEMDRLVAVADSYGKSTIYCTYEFAATMVPSEGWVSDNMRDQKWNNGYLANYKGHNVIVLNQSFVDETNTTKVIEPGYAWIIPAGNSEKPVKIAFEGTTLVDERANADWSREIQVYKKLGVGALITNNICVYRNESLNK